MSLDKMEGSTGWRHWVTAKVWPALTKWCADGIGRDQRSGATSSVGSLKLVPIDKYEETYARLKAKYYQR